MKNLEKVNIIIKLNWPQAKKHSISEFTEGFNNHAYDVNIDGSEFVIKLIKNSSCSFLKHNIFTELVKDKNINVAKIINYDLNNKQIGVPYIITEKLEGISLESEFNSLNNKEEIFEQIGELYGKIHSINFKKYGELNSNSNLIQTYDDWYKKQCHEVEKILAKIENKNLFETKLIQNIKNYFEENKHLLKYESDPCLSHGDAAFSNIIIKKENNKYVLNGIIDFEFSSSGGMVMDLFNSVKYFKEKYKYKQHIVKGHQKYSKLPEHWEELAIFYYWKNIIEQISVSDELHWRNLNKKQNEERQNKLKNRNILKLKELF